MAMRAEDLEELIRSERRRSLATAILRLGARSPSLRSGLFAFIDVLPSLRSLRDVAAYFEMYVGNGRSALPFWAKTPLSLARFTPFNAASGYVMSQAVKKILAPHFIVSGERDLEKLVKKYHAEGTAIVVDVLGELVLSQSEADSYRKKYHELLDRPSFNGDLHLAIKLSSLCPFFGPQNYDYSVREGAARLREIAFHAQAKGAHVTVDAEHYGLCHMTEEIFLNVATSSDFRNWPNFGIAIQAYRKDAALSATRIAFTADRLRGAPVTVRLIKGAYWDTEYLTAEQNGWPFPLYTRKAETDANFLSVASRLMDFRYSVSPAFGTHNPESIAGVLELAHKRSTNNFEFQTLYGLGDPVRRALVKSGLPVRVYVPFGDLTSGMAYFARRVLENTANEGFMLKLLES